MAKTTMWEHVSQFLYFPFIFRIISSLCSPKRYSCGSELRSVQILIIFRVAPKIVVTVTFSLGYMYVCSGSGSKLCGCADLN